ncbi:MAG: hypothetical protein N2442_02680 [Spirochaetes bacterium]|nr:hypothetical protein [Spirochaetota bacterium]
MDQLLAQRVEQKSEKRTDPKAMPTDEKRVVFVEGPILGRGIPYLSVNAIPYELGRYQYQGISIDVYFIRRSIPLLESWIPVRCGGSNFYQVKPDSSLALMAISPNGFSVLFVIPAEPWRCQILEPLWNRISNLYQNLGSNEPPFPAFIETR